MIAGFQAAFQMHSTGRTLSTSQLVKLAKKQGWTVKHGTGEGSHVRMEHPNSPSLTVPGNRRDLSPGVVKAALKAFGGYRLDDLAALLYRL
jgi:predicted RNA binding protein YcfA (HicA-like mRNA interferase family)